MGDQALAGHLRLSTPERRVLFTIGFGTIVTAVDASAVNAVLPLIRDGLGTSIQAAGWIVLAELLATSGLLLAFGRLGDQRGHKRIYLAGFAVFLLGAALCARAGGVASLVVFRVLQGIGTAMLLSNSPAILVKHFSAKQRGQALGLRASFTYSGLVIGPAVGGWLAARYGWRSVFLMQLPAGLLALAFAWRMIPEDLPAQRRQRFDLPGAGVWLCALGALLLALNRGPAWGWNSGVVAVSLVAAAGLLAAFVIVERGNRDALIDLTLFGNPAFSAAVASLVLNFLCGYMLTFLLPFYLIQARHIGAATAGLLIAANALVRAVTAPFSGTWHDRIGSRLPVTLGLGVFACGLLMLSQLDERSSLAGIAVAITIAGIGSGMFVSPNNSMLMGAAPPSLQGVAAAILATSRTFGMAMGVAVASAILSPALAGRGDSGHAARLIHGVDTGFAVAAAIALLGAILCLAAPSGERRRSATPPVSG